ncbi:thioredoxin family protein [Oceanispirochaeta sp.]|jgi:thioredoxin-related protein|uniref:thioredoxin family protein n=1 Tax=Oceanispirochaeta sp. TaxID=2035350 RepID=UPI0026162B23|nr:thioredoxin family protein [Oceanispirochaeta sp.]MDA3957392.1 thioredoxin family protein [Oceanispirochaeta sp.]
MKTFAISVFLLFSSLSFISADAYPPVGWTSDVLSALSESEDTGKDILLNFTGSDWCSWCHKLWAEVFGTKEFKEYAEENYILVYLDFPNGIKQTEEVKKQNEVMSSLFGVKGFPTIWLMDSTQLPLMKTGYQAGGSSAYIKKLEEGRPDLDEATKEEYRKLVRQTIRDNIGSW